MAATTHTETDADEEEILTPRDVPGHTTVLRRIDWRCDAVQDVTLEEFVAVVDLHEDAADTFRVIDAVKHDDHWEITNVNARDGQMTLEWFGSQADLWGDL